MVAYGSSELPVAQSAQRTFVVSAVLRKGTEGFDIKLVHMVQPAATEDAALGAFTRAVQEQYPGYSLVSTLVSSVALPPCGFQAHI